VLLRVRKLIQSCNYFCSNDRTADVQGNGGAIDIRHNTSGTFIIGSNFERNKATNGGAVFGGDVTLISSIFTDNGAKGGHGGAVNLDSGVIRNSTFSFNIAAGDGPSVYTDGGVCPNGLNYACHGSDYQENTCNGILSSLNGGICNKFATSCAYPSASPSSTLTRVPTAIPTVHQSTYPTERPTRSPTFSPTKIPTMSPTPDSTSDPTKGPSSTPTISPTKSVSSVPSALPSNLPSEKPSFSLSSFPTSTPTFEESSGPSLNSSLSPSSIPTTEPSSTRSSGEATSWPSQILPSLSKLPTNAPTSILTSKPSSLQTFMPSSTPSTSVQPTVTCNMSQEDRSAEIDLIVSSLGNTDVNGEAQKEAVKWLVESDSYYVCPQSDHVVQRYAAAVVNKVLLQKDELSSEHECNWDGFTCDTESNIIGVDYKTRGEFIFDIHFTCNTLNFRRTHEIMCTISTSTKDTSAKKLPEELSLFEDMENLVIQNSQLTGRIPPSIFELQHLQQIDLDKNAMSGVITPVVNNTLERLDINFNEFSGSIDFLTAFPNLVEAHLDNNMFNGTIPSELGQLSSLRKYLEATVGNHVCVKELDL
jgi:hypothetical protein